MKRKAFSGLVIVALIILPIFERIAYPQESDDKPEVASSATPRQSVVTFLDRVKRSHADARLLVVPKHVSEEELKKFNTLLTEFDAINFVSANQAPTYATDDFAVTLVPLYHRNGEVEIIWLELTNVERKWLVSKIETIELGVSIERLIAFRDERPGATSVADVHVEAAFPEKVTSVIDRERWDEAAELAINYARENPPQPINRRPDSLRSLALTEEKIAELLAGDWDTEIVNYLGPYASDAILTGMRSESAENRRQAVHALWLRPVTQWNMQITVQLEDLLINDPEPAVRAEVVYMLNRLDDETAVSMLIGPALADNDNQVFNAVTSHLEHRKDPRAFAPLLKQLNLETDWQRQHKIVTALLGCDQEKAWEHVMQLALNEDSDGRGFQLIELAGRNWKITNARYFWPWPFELRELERIVYNVNTVEGEKYGQAEFDKLIEYISFEDSDPALRGDCIRALIALHPTDTSRLIKLAQDDLNEPYSFHRVLTALPTEDSIRFLMSEFSNSEEKRNLLVSDVGATGRWQVPLLMVMIDDPGLKGEFEFEFNPLDPRGPLYQETYRTNRAYSMLTTVLRNEGFEIAWTNSAHEKYDLQIEIGKVKAWWKQHGKAFLSNERVPEPKISSMLFID